MGTEEKGNECRRLASEGEKATRIGDATTGWFNIISIFILGIKLLEEALTIGIDNVEDLPLLSAIYSQLGNAYYAQKLYHKALTFHYNDLSLSRGLYNLGLAYLQSSVVERPITEEDYVNKLKEAIKSFEKHFEIAKSRNDDILCGLALGNLGNAYFYLGDYEQSIIYHLKRLDLAFSVGDKSSMRRSYTNIANAYVLLGNYLEALKYYHKALKIAVETSRKNLEAQLLYSLGNVETLQKNYIKAVKYYQKHLHLTRTLKDNVAEAKANSLLASALVELKDYPKALYFLTLNYNLLDKIGDESMKHTVMDEIKHIVERDPNAVLTSDNQIRLDATFDPENLTLDDMIFDSISDSSNNSKFEEISSGGFSIKLSTGTQPNQHLLPTNANEDGNSTSMPNIPISLESFIRECAHGTTSSTPKIPISYTSNTGSYMPTAKTPTSTRPSAVPKHVQSHLGNEVHMQEAEHFTHDSRHKNTNDKEHVQENDETIDDVYNILMRVQSNRFNDQRTDLVLNEITNKSDLLNRPLSDCNVSQTQKRRYSFFSSISQIPKTLSNHISNSSLSSKGSSRKSFIKNRNSFYGEWPLQNHNISDSKKKPTKLSKLKLQKAQTISHGGLAKFEEEVDGDSDSMNLDNNKRDNSNNSTDFTSDTSAIFREPKLPATRHQRVQHNHSYDSRETAQNNTLWSKKFFNLKLDSDQQKHADDLILDLIENLQSRRMDEQRAELGSLPGLNNPKLLENFKMNTQLSDESSVMGDVDERLYELIVQSQADRIEDQRSELGKSPSKSPRPRPELSNITEADGLTEAERSRLDEEEEVTNLVDRMRMGRYEEQRAIFSPSTRQILDENGMPMAIDDELDSLSSEGNMASDRALIIVDKKSES